MHTCCVHTQADAETYIESILKVVIAQIKL